MTRDLDRPGVVVVSESEWRMSMPTVNEPEGAKDSTVCAAVLKMMEVIHDGCVTAGYSGPVSL